MKNLNKLSLASLLIIGISSCSSTNTDYSLRYSSQDIKDMASSKLCQLFVTVKNYSFEQLLVTELRKRDFKLCETSTDIKAVPLSQAEIAQKELEREALVKQKEADDLRQAIIEDSMTDKAIENNYLNVTGLVAGMSTPSQVKRRQNDRKDVFVIGGFELGCSTEFLEEKLSSLVCVTGKTYYSRDILDDRKVVSNLEVHSTLVKGFTKKYGSPKGDFLSKMRTRLGVEHDVKRVFWTDKRGNKLELISRAGDTEIGGLTFESVEYIKAKIDTEEKEYKARNF